MNSNNQTSRIEAKIVRKGGKFAIMRAEGIELDIYIPFDVARAAGLESPNCFVIGEPRVITYMVQPDGRLRAASLGAVGSRLPQPKVVDQAKDGSWSILKLDQQMVYRIVRPGQPDEDCGSLADARTAVGKVIASPKTVGGKTNDPKLSQEMKQKVGKSKKAA